MKGIILAGGSGTRLYPITLPTIKQLLPIYDKPMIYYPLSVLLEAGCNQILIISTKKDIRRFEELFGDGKSLGITIEYQIQKKPNGIAEAFIIGEEFINKDPVWLILGDNLFFGENLPSILKNTPKNKGATIFGYGVSDPQRYGVIEFDSTKQVISIEEKPSTPKSNYVVTGLYYFDAKVCAFAKEIKTSQRGELEITDLNNIYLKKQLLNVKLIDRGFAWLDTGTFDSLMEASEFVRIMEKRQGLKIGCIEEIAYKKGLISKKQLEELAQPLKKNSYGQYLLKIVEGK